MLLAAGLSDGTSIISNIKISRDIEATIDCLRALGASVEIKGDTAAVTGTDPKNRGQAAALKCRESGSTIRFFLPLCLLSGMPACLEGTEKLLSRPLSDIRHHLSQACLMHTAVFYIPHKLHPF